MASLVGPRTWTHVINDDRSEAGAMSEVHAAELDRRADRIARVGTPTHRAERRRAVSLCIRVGSNDAAFR